MNRAAVQSASAVPNSASPAGSPLPAVFARLDRRLLALLEALHGRLDRIEDPALRGLVVTGLEVERLCAAEADDASLEQGLGEGELWAEVQRWRAEQDATVPPTPLEILRERFGLNLFETECLLVCLAAEVDRKYERLFGYLNDDVARRFPTVHLLSRLLAPAGSHLLETRPFLSADSPLLRLMILTWVDGEDAAAATPEPGRCLRVEPRLVPQLLGTSATDTVLARYRPALAYPSEAALLWAETPAAGRLVRCLERWLATGDAARRVLVALLEGAPGSGRRCAAEKACAHLGLEILPLDTRRVLADPAHRRILRLACRDSVLRGAVLFLDGGEALAESTPEAAGALRELETLVEELGWVLIVALDDARLLRDRFRRNRRIEIRLEDLAHGEQTAGWLHLMDAHDGIPAPDRAEVAARLASRFSLTPGQMSDAFLRAVSEHDLLDGDGDWDQALHLAARRVSTPRLRRFAERIRVRRRREELILPDDRHASLADIVRRVRYRGRVLDEWGYDRTLSRGKGLIALFSGPPGTGKTMAAEVIAGDLSLDLYSIDLSAVVSKYIGESEKNLAHIFHEARHANAILFFDEADALFGKRTEVRDAHDRYANIEVNYLLQRMESYEGIAILATNLRRNVDEAFLRRIHISVDFPLPGPEQRLQIWRSALPADAPRDETIDWSFLANAFELSGGSITNIGLGAAYLAAEAGGPIRMNELVRATGSELTKLGKRALPQEFGRYYKLLSDERSNNGPA